MKPKNNHSQRKGMRAVKLVAGCALCGAEQIRLLSSIAGPPHMAGPENELRLILCRACDRMYARKERKLKAIAAK